MLTRRTFLQLMAASTGVAQLTGSEFLAQTAARASTALSPNGSNGIKHVVVLMMENRSFDHFLGWLPGADGRHFYDLLGLLDLQGCGYSDPDHSWEGFLVQRNFGKMDGFLRRPTAPRGSTPGGDAGPKAKTRSRSATTRTSAPTAPARRFPTCPSSGPWPSTTRC